MQNIKNIYLVHNSRVCVCVCGGGGDCRRGGGGGGGMGLVNSYIWCGRNAPLSARYINGPLFGLNVYDLASFYLIHILITLFLDQ